MMCYCIILFDIRLPVYSKSLMISVQQCNVCNDLDRMHWAMKRQGSFSLMAKMYTCTLPISISVFMFIKLVTQIVL